MFYIPVSTGELIDKITILEIKQEKITDEDKLANVTKELELLNEIANKIPQSYATLKSKLKKVNESLWDIEDRIRQKEKTYSFDSDFINLARDVYYTNDKRAEIKREINDLTNSELYEEKQYDSYKLESL